MINSVKYAAFNGISNDVILCNVKSILARYIGCSVDTIRRKEKLTSSFIVGNWTVFIDTSITRIHGRASNLVK